MSGHDKTYFASGECPACTILKAARVQVKDAQQEALEARQLISDLEARIHTLERQLANRGQR